MKRTILRLLLGLLGAFLAVLLLYVGYLLVTYHRIPDNQDLTPESGATETAVALGEEYTITCYNVGFGAYLPDFTFFMDGGSQSRAVSAEAVTYAITGAADLISAQSPDFAIFEEVDLDADRSWHIDQYELLSQSFAGYDSTFAVNYDSAYLFYPFLNPIGQSRSGIAVYSRFPIQSALRRSLPIATDLTRFFDLDRCYSINRIPTEDGHQLVIYAVHLSAYTSDAAVRDGQLQLLFSDLEADVEAGNYVICGGDFNHDLKAPNDEGITFDWAHSLDRSTLPQGISVALDQLSQEEIDAFPDTTRNTDIPYTPGESFTVTIDGFLLSDNVEMTSLTVADTAFTYSDHNPVTMTFRLTPSEN
jgi:endonuclease/exonuclease/phosphatase family metal-dependent hydrolase